jgi:hypothetical protein
MGSGALGRSGCLCPNDGRREAMNNWKRLTDASGNEIDINFDHVVYVQKILDSYTDIMLVTGKALQVKEEPEEVHRAQLVIT